MLNRLKFLSSRIKSTSSHLIHKKLDRVSLDFNLINSKEHLSQAIIILNYKINIPWLQKFIQKVPMIVLADGGANRIYQTKFRDSPKIKALVGDLDSITNQVLQYYKNKNIIIQKIQNQNECDMQKSINFLKRKGIHKIICFGSFGGRMDHTIYHLSLAQKFGRQDAMNQIILTGRTSLMYFIKPNIQYEIIISNDICKQECGLISFSNAKVQTSGFEWNMGQSYDFHTLQWGKFQSTSNKIVGDKVQIRSNNFITFVCSLSIEQ